MSSVGSVLCPALYGNDCRIKMILNSKIRNEIKGLMWVRNRINFRRGEQLGIINEVMKYISYHKTC